MRAAARSEQIRRAHQQFPHAGGSVRTPKCQGPLVLVEVGQHQRQELQERGWALASAQGLGHAVLEERPKPREHQEQHDQSAEAARMKLARSKG